MVENDSKENLKIPDTSSTLRNTRNILNGLIVFLIILNIYLAYSFYFRPEGEKKDQSENQTPVKTIQINVLNGCGIIGIASQFTDILRQKGFDVVEMKNYISFDIPHTIVIDRIGNLEFANHVAAALGVQESNVIRQLNPDYFVDVTIVIGKDFLNLKSLVSSSEKEKY